METCEWLGNLTSKSIDHFAVETVRKRLRHLLAMNVPRRQSIRHGKSRKDPWHMAKTKTSGVGMTNAWFAEQGVLSLKSLLAELAHLRGTARLRTRMPCWCGEGGQETGILTRCYEYFVTPTCSSNAGRSSGGRFARW